MENKKNFLSAVIACYKDAQSIPIMHQRLSDIFSKQIVIMKLYL